jgi:hypothetical protein
MFKLLMHCKGNIFFLKKLRINQLDLELDEHFYDTMVPLIRDYVSRFT